MKSFDQSSYYLTPTKTQASCQRAQTPRKDVSKSTYAWTLWSWVSRFYCRPLRLFAYSFRWAFCTFRFPFLQWPVSFFNLSDSVRTRYSWPFILQFAQWPQVATFNHQNSPPVWHGLSSNKLFWTYPPGIDSSHASL